MSAPTNTPLGEALTFTSDYVTDELYDSLMRDCALARTLRAQIDTRIGAACAALLHHEARVIDEGRLDEWLALFSRECIYWIPFDEHADPRTHVNLAFDDRRRLEDRLLRLRSGHAHTMSPARRIQHVVSAVEGWEVSPTRRIALSSQTTFEYRRHHGVTRHVFRAMHVLVLEGEHWRIALKRCVLLDIDAAFEPPTLL